MAPPSKENISALAASAVATAAAQSENYGQQAAAAAAVCRAIIAAAAAHEDENPNQAIAVSCTVSEVHLSTSFSSYTIQYEHI